MHALELNIAISNILKRDSYIAETVGDRIFPLKTT
jgi:hypothetical protein